MALYLMFPKYFKASKADYVEHVLPSLKPVMKLMEPIQILLIFMQVAFTIFLHNFLSYFITSSHRISSKFHIVSPYYFAHFCNQRMELLLEKTPPEDVRSDVLPMVYRALESGVSQIQELCLSIIPSFAGNFDFCPGYLLHHITG